MNEKTDYESLYIIGVIGGWYLRDSQYKFYELLRDKKKVVANCHRRFGKGTTVFTHVFEQMARRKIIVRYGAETQTQAYSIYNFLSEKIHHRSPKSRLTWNNQLKCFENKRTKSQLYIFGVKDSGEIDKARGVEAHIIICDEFGFWKFKPDYIVKSVLTPQLLETNGQMIIISTPPPDMTHKFVDYCVEAELHGYHFKWTIDDTVAIGEKTQEDLASIIADCGELGRKEESFQREWMCELIASKERLVVPEAQKEDRYVGSTSRPTHYDSYVCMDLGLIDHTFVCFGYLDFKDSRLIIERELMVHYTTTGTLINQCKAVESEMRWVEKPYRRIGDSEMQQLFDMTTDHDYTVTPIVKRTSQSGKGFKESVINGLRIGIKEGRILINPKTCPNLCKQLKFGIWNERRTDFQRTETMGHLDGIMSLAYLLDNINWGKNPFPDKYEGLTQQEHHINESVFSSRRNAGYQKLIGQ